MKSDLSFELCKMHLMQVSVAAVLLLFCSHFVGGDEDCLMVPDRCEQSLPKVVNDVTANTTCPDDVITFHVDETYQVSTNFTPLTDATNVTAIVEIQLLVLDFSIRFTEAACSKKGMECPLKANHTYIYSPVFPATLKIPKDLDGTVMWSMVDEHDATIFCVTVKVLLKANKPDPPMSFHVVP